MLVVEGLDVRLAGFVLVGLSAVTLQLYLAFEDIHISRYRMLVQRRPATRLNDPDDGDDLWFVRLRIDDGLFVARLTRLQQRLGLEAGGQRTVLSPHCRGTSHEPDCSERCGG